MLDKLKEAELRFEKIDEELFADFSDEELSAFGAVLERLQNRLRGMGAADTAL